MQIIALSGKWRLTDGEHTVEGNVPGDITDDLYRAKLVPDPYFGNNYKECLWAVCRDWTYERDFRIENISRLEENTYIRLEGVDTYSEVRINGVLIGETRNMHLEYVFPVNGLLREGENSVSVKLFSVYTKMGTENQTKYDSIFNKNRVFVRKAQCHFGWDWAPPLPGYGIYRDISIVSEKKSALKETGIKADVGGDVTFKLAFGEKFKGKLEIEILKNDRTESYFEKLVDCKKFLANLHVETPNLWWPNGYGGQDLYDYKIRMMTETYREEYRGRFGFRKIQLDRSVIDKDNLTFGFIINGKRIFCRGSNWVPAECMTGRLKNEKYYALLKAAKDANFNMLRVWGGGIYEKDCFYDYCDEMGIMVWQDFMFSCSEIPEDDPAFVTEITKEAVWQVKRLRNHPCLTYWCGENEIRGAFGELEERYSYFTLHYLLRGIVAELSADTPYERTSPFAFADTENDVSEGDCHNNLSEACLFSASFKGFDEFKYGEQTDGKRLKERIKNYERYLEGTISNFSSECAVLGMCNYESLIKFTPPEYLCQDSEFFSERFLGNPYTYVMPTFFERQKKISEAMYGKSGNLKDLVRNTNKAQLDIMKSEIVYARSNGRSRGFLNWMYNDIWPTGTWSVIDYYLSKKPAYYEMKRCFKPVMAEIIRIGEKYYLCTANDTEERLDCTAEIGIYDYDGTEKISENYSWKLGPGATLKKEISVDTQIGDYIGVRGSCGRMPLESVYDLGRYKEIKRIPDYFVACEPLEKGVYRLRITAKTFVPCIKIYAGEAAEIEDNYFDLAAGSFKEVLVTTQTGKENVRVRSFADVWDE